MQDPQLKDTKLNMDEDSAIPPQKRQPQATMTITDGARNRQIFADTEDFKQHLADHKIYCEGYPYGNIILVSQPNNLFIILGRLAKSRSRAPTTFERFKARKIQINFKNDVMRKIVPILCGRIDVPTQRDTLFAELDPITSDNTPKPKPDHFDGARLHELHKLVREDQDLRSKIIPTKHPRVPVLPNFFLEVEGPDGSPSVSQTLACYHGAYGARAMHALQNYGMPEPTYDGNAYAFSATFYDDHLKLYAHHLTAPTTPGGRPEYHITQLRSLAMSDSYNSYCDALISLRNLRELAQLNRDDFIQAANDRAAMVKTDTA